MAKKINGYLPVFSGLVIGALVVGGFSIIPKIIAGQDPLIPESYLFLLLAGGGGGGVIGHYHSEVKKLKKALAQCTLSQDSFIPICANCKKIRVPDTVSANNNSWQGVESYISAKTAIQFSHTVCPECTAKLYGKKYN